MKIALMTHIRHPVRPPFMGGMEAHGWHLARALVARGHEVTLLASGDSAAPPGVRLHPVVPEHYDRRYPWHDFHGTEVLIAHLDAAFAGACDHVATGGYDVVHNNTLHRFVPRVSRAKRLPMVSSMHVPPFEVLRRAMTDSVAPWHLVTTCSTRQLGRWWEVPPTTARVVGNGIALDDWPFSPRGDGSAVWAGRITPTKGTHLAAQAARIAGVPLTLFGVIEHRDYFEAEVKPHLGGDVRYGGHLAGVDLAQAFGRASVLLFTPLWDEPFGLAAIEAMACGLPVAAIDQGAVREVIGDSGAYAPPNDPDALARAILTAMTLPRAAARARVEARFSIRAMVDGYEALYAEAVAAREADWPNLAYAPHQLRMTPAAIAGA
ncbi:LOW QUALITY PROTEIN: glycosyltransferase [Limimaricola cinnabarinus LL-001]|uniref:Glycosyltransferase n=1 Tax=Limimaricola cinnabarinus LL-001 TaxID=1337093 RepID=U3AKA8_9RHOB|nr:LOW QUALITY PROTEIN: glycosyltransferase [Limimaricola cinnabarinus LL-001]